MSYDHYTILKVPTVGDGDSSQDTLVAGTTTILDDTPTAPSLVTSSVLRLFDSGSGAEIHLVAQSLDVATLSFDVVFPASVMISSQPICGGADHGLDGCGDEVFAWQKTAGFVEDGWTTVKGKKVKPSTPFDMALHSQKSGPKGKG